MGLNLKAEVDNRNRFFFFQFFYFGQSQTTKTSIRKMLLAAFTIGAILGSSSVAQAGRKCIACVARRNGTTVNADCNQSDVSEYIPNAPNAHTQFDAEKIMIQGRFCSFPLYRFSRDLVICCHSHYIRIKKSLQGG